MPFNDWRQKSRDVQWGNTDRALSREDINAGSLLRIADATEQMAASYDQMRQDRDYWKERAESRLQRITTLEHRTAALRGVITRMKRKGAQG